MRSAFQFQLGIDPTITARTIGIAGISTYGYRVITIITVGYMAIMDAGVHGTASMFTNTITIIMIEDRRFFAKS